VKEEAGGGAAACREWMSEACGFGAVTSGGVSGARRFVERRSWD
jgi:hypothetical protein